MRMAHFEHTKDGQSRSYPVFWGRIFVLIACEGQVENIYKCPIVWFNLILKCTQETIDPGPKGKMHGVALFDTAIWDLKYNSNQ